MESHGTKIEELEELVKAQAALIEKLGRDSKELSRQQSISIRVLLCVCA